MTFTLLPLRDDPRAPTAKDDRPGCGCLMVTHGGQRLSLPLRSVRFGATVVERTAEVTVEQVFENPHQELLEAVYIFPLSGSAAVSRFELEIGEKRLVGLVEERGEARRQYQVALAEGRKAALLEQERDDVFTVKVGNLPPGERAKIRLVYSERLPAFDDGETELRIPLVVAPRYIPGNPLERASTGEGTESDTTAVPDASRISPPRLAPGLRGDVALEIAVELRGEDEVQDLGCTQHATRLGMGSGRLSVKLAKKDELLDRDFVLRWKSAATVEKPLLYVTRKGDACYGVLSLVPPRDVKAGAGARDVLFLLDRSGSMQGAKLESARRAVAALLETLAPQDRFALAAFDTGSAWFKSGFLARKKGVFSPANAASLSEARQWVNGIGAGGGTELLPALDESLGALDELAKERESEGRLRVVVIVTDGQVGNEAEILRRVEARADGLRVFTLGIDTAVNAAFLRRMAQIGRGTATLCAPGPELEGAVERIGKEIGSPVLLDLAVEDAGLGLEGGSLTPERLPDLFAGRTASVFFRCKNAAGSLRVRARRAGGGTFDQVVAAEPLELAAVPQLWAKSRVSDLEDRFRVAYGGVAGGLEAARGQILELALEHQLLTRFTAFLVVDRDEAARRLALPRRTVVQAVEQPAGWADVDALKLAAPVNLPGPPPFASAPSPRVGAFAPPPSFPMSPAPASARAFAPMDPGARDSRGSVSGGGGGDPFGAPAAGAFDGFAPPPPPPSADPLGMLDLDDELPPPQAKKAEADPFASQRTPTRAPPTGPAAPGGASFAGRDARVPAPSLEATIEALGKELARVLVELERGIWPGADELERLRAQAVAAFDARGLAPRARGMADLLGAKLVALVQELRAKRSTPAETAELARRGSESLATLARAELAPLLGKGGAPWEASI